jgi:hypothetical protein
VTNLNFSDDDYAELFANDYPSNDTALPGWNEKDDTGAEGFWPSVNVTSALPAITILTVGKFNALALARCRFRGIAWTRPAAEFDYHAAKLLGDSSPEGLCICLDNTPAHENLAEHFRDVLQRTGGVYVPVLQWPVNYQAEWSLYKEYSKRGKWGLILMLVEFIQRVPPYDGPRDNANNNPYNDYQTETYE